MTMDDQDTTAPARQRGGQTKYTEELADAICEMLASGSSLRKAAEANQIDPSTVLRWCDSFPEFSQRYAQVRARGYELLADELLEISDDSSGDIIKTEHGDKPNAEFVARSRLRVDARKWLLAKMLPKKYGDKLDLNHGGTVKFEKIECVVVDPAG